VSRTDRHNEIQSMLSAYLDQELTQGNAQKVEVHLAECGECRVALREISEIQQLTANMSFRPPPEAAIEGLEHRISVQAPRAAGWGLIIIGLTVWLVSALIVTLRNLRLPTLPELLGGSVVAGVVLVFVSVLRQRLLERPLDRYRKVRK
jgi:anti-sigma factor RsiW